MQYCEQLENFFAAESRKCLICKFQMPGKGKEFRKQSVVEVQLWFWKKNYKFSTKFSITPIVPLEGEVGLKK